jgi:hypothetical protein
LIDTAQLVVLADDVHPPESTRTCTLATPAWLEAAPDTVKVPSINAPPCGLEIEITGGVLVTVTVTLVVPVLRWLSTARAVMVWPALLRLFVFSE